MAEQGLDDADIDTVLQQVGGKAVPQGVRSDPLGDVGCLGGFDDDAVKLAGADRQHGASAREEPAIGVQHTLLPPRAPPVAQQHEQALWQHGVAIAPALAAFDPEQHALAVDIAHLERRDLADAQASATGDRQGGLVLETGGCIEKPLHLALGQHHRDLAGMRGADQLARKLGPVERMREEEPQRRHDAVHGRRRHPGFPLLDLEPADILGGRSMPRASQPGRELPHIALVVTLRLRAEVPDGHILDQPLAKRADRPNRNNLVHRSTPWLKEPRCSALFDLPATTMNHHHLAASATPAKRIRAAARKRP